LWKGKVFKACILQNDKKTELLYENISLYDGCLLLLRGLFNVIFGACVSSALIATQSSLDMAPTSGEIQGQQNELFCFASNVGVSLGSALPGKVKCLSSALVQRDEKVGAEVASVQRKSRILHLLFSDIHRSLCHLYVSTEHTIPGSGYRKAKMTQTRIH
jgi:hypothetical protein